jgi:hypothetical protein
MLSLSLKKKKEEAGEESGIVSHSHGVCVRISSRFGWRDEWISSQLHLDGEMN